MTFDDLETLRTSPVFYDVKDQLKNHIYARSRAAFDAGDAARDRVRDAAGLRARQEAMRSAFIAALGGLPASDTPLHAEVRGTVEEEGLRIERVVFQSRPGSYVTANLYLPAGVTKPTAAVLFLSGHFHEARLSDEYQVVCRHLAAAGLVVLAQDPVGQGERWSYWEPSLGSTSVAPGTSEHDYAGSQCLPLGDGIARYFVHDAMRGIDYLRTRPEVDPSRIGVTGNSGGGTQTSLVMVCDPRIAAAAPGTFIMNRRTYQAMGQAQDAEQIWKGVTAFGFDHEDILLAMAPRPVLVLAVTHDFFPIEGTRSTVARCRRLWEIAGAKDCLELFEDAIEHHYSPRMAARTAEFFTRHLNGAAVKVDSAGIRPLPGPAALVRQVGAGAGGDRRRPVRLRGERRAARGDRGGAGGRRRGRPESGRGALAPLAGLQGPAAVRADHTALEGVVRGSGPRLRGRLCMWWSQEDLHGGGVLLRDPRHGDERLPLAIGLWQHGTGAAGRFRQWIRRTCDDGRAVLVLDVSGSGMLEPNAINSAPKFGYYGTMFKLADDLVWLDDSLPALRTWELIRALDVAAATFDDVDPADVVVHAEGRFTLYAELAAFLDPRFGRLELENRFEGFADLVRSRHYVDADVKSIVLPDVLRHFDLDDLRRWKS